MTKATGTLALARRRRVDRAVPRARQPAARSWPVPTRSWCCPTAAAFEHPDRVGRAGDRVVRRARAPRSPASPVLNRRDAEADANVAGGARRAFVYLADGSPLHLRSVLKGSALFDAMRRTRYGRGAVIAASGAGATVRVRPDGRPARRRVHRRARARAAASRCSPYHGGAADHLRERSVELLARGRGARRPRRADRARPRGVGAVERRWAPGTRPCTAAAQAPTSSSTATHDRRVELGATARSTTR